MLAPKTFRIEPAEHLIELFPQNDSDHRHGKLLKADGLAEHTAEHLRCLGIGEFAAGDLQFEAEEDHVS
jgi:hypothetical protein